ncbi:MAG: restriction endonuclease subunit S, partial [Actinobacteria bacterium]|nr:restriction endonuclease subunit S [Actinomycetota bacterium]
QEKIAEILSAVDQVIEEVGESINKTEQLKKGLMQELLTRGIGHEEFKETEIGRIPKEWKVIKLENLLCLEYGDGLTDRERRGSEYPVYGSNGIIGYNSKYLVEGPGIIVGRKGTIGAIKWSEVNFWPIDTTYYVKLKELRINLRWLFYKLSTLSLSKLNMATGTPGLNRDLVYKLKISVPLFQEQERIVEILLTIDKRIQFLKEKKNKLEKVKKGLMSELLTGRKRVKA